MVNIRKMEEKTIIEKPTFSSFFWIFLISVLLLISVFLVRQIFFLPVSPDTFAALVLEGSEQKVNSLKKYFPKPYSVQDLTRGDYDRH